MFSTRTYRENRADRAPSSQLPIHATNHFRDATLGDLSKLGGRNQIAGFVWVVYGGAPQNNYGGVAATLCQYRLSLAQETSGVLPKDFLNVEQQIMSRWQNDPSRLFWDGPPHCGQRASCPMRKVVSGETRLLKLAPTADSRSLCGVALHVGEEEALLLMTWHDQTTVVFGKDNTKVTLHSTILPIGRFA